MKIIEEKSIEISNIYLNSISVSPELKSIFIDQTITSDSYIQT
jgi:hypothetical protein